MKRSLLATLIFVPGAALAADPVTDPKDMDGSEADRPSVSAETAREAAESVDEATDALAGGSDAGDPVATPRDDVSAADERPADMRAPASDDAGQRPAANVTGGDLDDAAEDAANLIDGEPTEADERPEG